MTQPSQYPEREQGGQQRPDQGQQWDPKMPSQNPDQEAGGGQERRSPEQQGIPAGGER